MAHLAYPESLDIITCLQNERLDSRAKKFGRFIDSASQVCYYVVSVKV
jgi:hypothetical protein